MTLSTLVTGMAELYYHYRQDSEQETEQEVKQNIKQDAEKYLLFVSKAEELVKSSRAEYLVNSLHKDLLRTDTTSVLDAYVDLEGTVRNCGHVSMNDASDFVGDVLYYCEFFIKFQLLYSRIDTEETKTQFKSLYFEGDSIDATITSYNESLASFNIRELRSYMVSARSSYSKESLASLTHAESKKTEKRKLKIMPLL